MSEQTWPELSKTFEEQRDDIKQVLKKAGRLIHLGELCTDFISQYGYLPSDVCRRLRELVKNREIIVRKTDVMGRKIPHYKLNR